MVQAPFSLGTFSVIRGQSYFLSHVLTTRSSGRQPTTRARNGPQAGEDAAASLGPNQTSQGPSENNNGGTSATVSTTGNGPPQWFTAAISGLRSEIAETRSVASQAVEATASLTTTVGQLKKKKTAAVDRPAPAPAVLKKPDLARQHAFNERVLTSVDAALESLPDDADSPWANSKIPTFHFFSRGGRFDFINWFILPRITGNRLLGGEKGAECCVLDESLKQLSLPWQHKLSSRCNAFLAIQ